jgi:SAM-dependent methyltransferase
MPKMEPFEKYYRDYESWFEENKYTYESEVEAIRSQLSEKAISLEIGVGSGRFAQPIGVKFGLDPSKRMAQIAQKRGISVIQGIAENIPLGDFSVDFALMVTTVCFLDDLDLAFKEAYRVLKPNGCFLIGLIDRNSPLGKLYQLYKNSNPFYKIATFYSVDEIVSSLKNANFKKFNFAQTIFQDLEKIKQVEPVKAGFGEGSFVVIRTIK